MHLRHESPIQFYQVNGLDLTNLSYSNASLPMYQVHALKAHVQKPVHPGSQCTKARAPTPAVQSQWCILLRASNKKCIRAQDQSLRTWLGILKVDVGVHASWLQIAQESVLFTPFEGKLILGIIFVLYKSLSWQLDQWDRSPPPLLEWRELIVQYCLFQVKYQQHNYSQNVHIIL